ncbi:MAG TPA: hypothetical protein DCE56_24660 [Cyanobacteria bacterium UBA8553]|nr:hypothetical protein [Cyanobacteria bacterium UBA8553]
MTSNHISRLAVVVDQYLIGKEIKNLNDEVLEKSFLEMNTLSLTAHLAQVCLRLHHFGESTKALIVPSRVLFC